MNTREEETLAGERGQVIEVLGDTVRVRLASGQVVTLPASSLANIPIVGSAAEAFADLDAAFPMVRDGRGLPPGARWRSPAGIRCPLCGNLHDEWLMSGHLAGLVCRMKGVLCGMPGPEERGAKS